MEQDPLKKLTELLKNPPHHEGDGLSEAEANWEAEVTDKIRRLIGNGETMSVEEVIQQFPECAPQAGRCLATALNPNGDSNEAPALSNPGSGSGFNEALDVTQDSQAPDSNSKNMDSGNSGDAGTSGETSERQRSRTHPDLDVTTDQGQGDAAPVASTPKMLGRYRVESTLGSGGFGVVYKAVDEQLERYVAIKVARRVARKGKGAKSDLAEARFLAKLDHPGIVSVHDVGQTEEGALYIVSNYIEGADLAQYQRENRLTYRDAARIVSQLAEALDYAHGQGVVHRDIKPGNILLSTEGEPILVDFGLAIDEADMGQGSTFVGTPAYMSPEQARREGHRVDGRSDIYSLGAVFYQLLTGSRPFNAASVPALLELIKGVEVRPPRQIDRKVPRELERICLRALSKRVGDRYSSAGDMAEEIALWEKTPKQTVTQAVAGSSGSTLTDPTSASRSTEHAVIPRGLRAYDSNDADFFLRLLPGPTDRDGLPESVRFWKTRIEETEPEQTFSVGVILGPSGSGKSSLVRAGIIPHLDDDVIPIWADTRAQDMERRLLKRIKKRFPALDGSSSLHDALVAVRRNRGVQSGKKLLLVFDQFEQWLNLHRSEESSELADALRQCDGGRLQALLLIRDDFTLDAANFMDRIEEPLSQTRNFAAVDLFGKEHARKVLLAFGRAFGAIADSVPREQQKFLDAVVAGLADSGRIIPIQLALFADMVKDKPWTMATLREYGGMRGIGVAFLEEKLAGAGAHPYLRSQSELTAELLRLLLPEEDVLIKGNAKTRSELIQHFSHMARPDSLDRVLGLLDSELRLITPSGGEAAQSAESSTAIREPAYQLTHDYLVPTIRSWLTASERSTRRGRVRLRLNELSESWSVKQDARRLPTLLEWSAIRLWTRSADWTQPHQKMMRSADRRMAMRFGLAFLIALVLGVTGYEGSGRWRGSSLRDRLLNADTAEVGSIVNEMRPNWRWVSPLLRQALKANPKQAAEGKTPVDDRAFRRRLHLGLALSSEEPKFAVDTMPDLHLLAPDELAVVATFYAPLGKEKLEPLWKLVNDPSLTPDARLAAGVILAATQPDNKKWPQVAAQISTDLSLLRPFQVPDWVEYFVPVQDHLLPSQVAALKNPEDLPGGRPQLENAIELISVYAKNDPAVLAKAISRVDAKQVEPLLAALRPHGRAGALALRREFDAIVAATQFDAPAVADVAALGEEFGGFAIARGGVAIRVPQEELNQVAQRLADAGQSLVSLRTFAIGKKEFAAVAWVPGRAECVWKTGLTKTSFRAELDRLEKEQIYLIDLDVRISDQGLRFAGLWRRGELGEKPLVFIDEPFEQEVARQNELGDFALERYASYQTEGRLRCSTLWRAEASAEPQTAFARSRLGAVFGDAFPGYLQTDIRLSLFDEQLRPASNEHIRMLQLLGDSKKTSVMLKRLKVYLGLGQFKDALAIADAFRKISKSSQTVSLLRAESLAGLKDSVELGKEVAFFESLKGSPAALALMQVRLAALQGEAAAAREALERMETAIATEAADPDGLVMAARANMAAASMLDGDSDEQAKLHRRATQLLAEFIGQSSLGDAASVAADVEFAELRKSTELRALLQKMRLDRRYECAWSTSAREFSRVLFNQSQDLHAREGRQLMLEGFQPSSVHVAVDSESRQPLIASTWRRKAPQAIDRQRGSALAMLAIALAHLRETEYLLEALRDSHGRSVRSQAIEGLAISRTPATHLVEAFRENTSATLRRSLLLALGNYRLTELSQDDQGYLRSRLRTLNLTAVDSALRSAAVWVAKRWGIELSEASERTLANRGERDWFVNSAGQTMVIRKAGEVLMGSPTYEVDRQFTEDLYWVRINRTFAIADRETTIAQFQEFLKDPRVAGRYKDKPFYYTKSVAPSEDCPQGAIRWYDAAKFCQWLSEREGLPDDQWVFPGIWEYDPDDPKQSWSLPENYLSRTGYRLPTEAEWEFSCRAGSRSARPYGDDESLLDSYAWGARKSRGRLHPVGSLKPNDFGLFDTLGNASEWCQEPSARYRAPLQHYARIDTETSSLRVGSTFRVNRGGGIASQPGNLRCARRGSSAPNYHPPSSGFRVARTMP